MRQNYSRLINTEQKRNVRNAVKFGFLTLIAIIALIFFGIPVLGKFTAFISDLGGSGKIITKNDKTPPAPPQFDTFNEFTNQTKITLTGRSEPGAIVTITFNNKEEENITNKDNNFTFNFALNNGENTFLAMATDEAGNKSLNTQTYIITFDNKKPELTVTSPSDGTSFFGPKQRQVTVEGKTEPEAQLLINDRVVSVENDGGFKFTTTLNEGENKFLIKAMDEAGNSTETELTLNFTS